MGVLDHFHGRLGHGHWKAYLQFNCTHFLCNAQDRRELECAAEQDGQRWAGAIKELLLSMNEAIDRAGGCLETAPAEDFDSRYRRILTEGELESPAAPPPNSDGKRAAQSRSRNLLGRLRDFETEALRLMTDLLVAFTNNRVENDLRMTTVQQKISSCHRSSECAQIFARICSYLSTCQERAIHATEAAQSLIPRTAA